jgi:hypothetical protein
MILSKWKTRLKTGLGWLFGLFILWQLFFPIIANSFEFIPLRPTAADERPPSDTTQIWGRFTDSDTLQSTADGLGAGLAWYAQFTGQEQGWDMFTPGFPPNTVVPMALFIFPDGREEKVYSRFDPRTAPKPLLRVPFRHDREFNFEANLFMLAWHFDPRRPADQKDQPDLVKKVRENEQLIQAWFKYQMQKYQQEQRPSEVHLVLRYFPIAKPWRNEVFEPFDWPLARWRPQVAPPVGQLAIEAFDPGTKQFCWIEAWEQP